MAALKVADHRNDFVFDIDAIDSLQGGFFYSILFRMHCIKSSLRRSIYAMSSLYDNQGDSMKYTLDVNSQKHVVEMAPETPLLYALRNDLQFNGPKFGCGLAQCGACTVHLSGQPIRSCVTPVAAVLGQKITTIEGLGTVLDPSPVQAAFIAEQAGQCGYCLSGMVMTATALLASNKNPSDKEIRTAMNGNLCRCGTHLRIMRAVKRAAKTMQGESA